MEKKRSNSRPSLASLSKYGVMLLGLPSAPTEWPAKLSIRITTTFLIGRVRSAGGTKSRRIAASSASTSVSWAVSSCSRTLCVATSCCRTGFQMLARSSPKRLLAASIRVRVPLRPSWLTKLESVVKASPQRIGGPWRRVPRAATTATSRITMNTARRLYHGATRYRPSARVARSIPLNSRLSSQVPKAQASR
ncbi:hypothetical protein D3C79_804860 [compost metagenome]